MKPTADDNWWMSIFDDLYLQTDARSVCDDQLTNQEVNFLESGLNISKHGQILDLCGGQGRHAMELSRRGFSKIVVFDYSNYLLSAGKKIADRENLALTFVRGDARYIGLQDGCFEFIMLMGSSFGYFINQGENRKILTESFRLLMPQGTILLDLPDKNHVITNFKPFAHHRVNKQLEVTRERKLEKDVIYCRERVMNAEGQCIRDNQYYTRLYSQQVIQDMLEGVGFHDVRFETDFMRRDNMGDYGSMTNRMIVLASKRLDP
jgi:D-alanine-D-alanine ligase